MAASPGPDPAPPASERPTAADGSTDARSARRVQMLATEHWGLLAACSTAQVEVLTRITIFLTLVSASLLTIGVLGQATRFDGWFTGAALAILAFLSVMGLLTLFRVMNVAEEDLMYVLAMNRLRGAYVELDPEIEPYLLASSADDRDSIDRTYSFLRTRTWSHLLGSSGILLLLVDTCVWGLFLGGIALAAGVPLGWSIALGAVLAIGLAAIPATFAFRNFERNWERYVPRRTSTPPPYLRPGA
ncbi:hypothetical protein [Agromyces sp. ZXT2-6]|uniref:hypothetical protein n=1 Tax=Agromyces sp. ZXT2-6 TaxID=3461153 RepID=UPI004054E12A